MEYESDSDTSCNWCTRNRPMWPQRKKVKLENKKGKKNHCMDTSSDKLTRLDRKIVHDIKAKIDNMQQNSKCRFCGDKHEMVCQIISECSKLATKRKKSTKLPMIWCEWRSTGKRLIGWLYFMAYQSLQVIW